MIPFDVVTGGNRMLSNSGGVINLSESFEVLSLIPTGDTALKRRHAAEMTRNDKPLDEIPTATCEPSEIAIWKRLKFRRGT